MDESFQQRKAFDTHPHTLAIDGLSLHHTEISAGWGVVDGVQWDVAFACGPASVSTEKRNDFFSAF